MQTLISPRANASFRCVSVVPSPAASARKLAFKIPVNLAEIGGLRQFQWIMRPTRATPLVKLHVFYRPKEKAAMRVVTKFALAACALMSVTGLEAATEADVVTQIENGKPLMEKLVGRWTLTGTLAGKPARDEVRAEWTLQGNYVRLEEKSVERDKFGKPTYEATIFIGWDDAARTYRCIWLDSTEVINGSVTCDAVPAPNKMPFSFKTVRDGVILTNTFTYFPASDQWTWAIDNITKDKSEPFARLTLSRRR
jgi:hypothetical protein